MIRRGGIHWAELGAPTGSRPAKRRPVLVVQADSYNRSGLNTTLVISLTTNTMLAPLPGNVFLPATRTGLPKDSVANVTQWMTLDKDDLEPEVGWLAGPLLGEVERGLRRVLSL